MFTLIKSGLLAIGDQLRAPWQWFTDLPFIDWQLPLLIVIAVMIFYRRLIVFSVMARYALGDWVADQFFVREWNYYARMNAVEFRKAIDALAARSQREEEAANRLEERAGRGVRLPGGASTLYQEAEKRRARGLKILDEVQRLKELRATIDKEKAAQGGGAKRVVGLMNRLASRNQAEAEESLAELNRLGVAFDWGRLLPGNLPDPVRQVAIKTLRLMAGTGNIGEAQTAYGRVLRMLESHGMTWRDMAA